MSRRNTFLVLWLATALCAGWFVIQGQRSFAAPWVITIILTLTIYTTIGFLWWLPKPNLSDLSGAIRNRQSLFVIAVVGVGGILSLSYWFFGLSLLFGLPVIGLIVLVVFRRQVEKRELFYALGLGGIAGIAALAAGINFVSPTVWAILQLCLVLASLPAGWSILRQYGLLQVGVGRSRFISNGFGSALTGFAQGVGLCIPWTLSAVILGASKSEAWVQAWWQPLTALQPAIAEEAWGRILLVPLVFIILRRFAKTQMALTAAIIVVGYAFAYWHTVGNLDWFTTIMMGTLLVVPLSFLCLYGNLETAMGFHFGYDFGTSLIPFLMIQGF
jgi:hypothetical protein